MGPVGGLGELLRVGEEVFDSDLGVCLAKDGKQFFIAERAPRCSIAARRRVAVRAYFQEFAFQAFCDAEFAWVLE